jgi:hypothetical protein
LPLLLDSHHHGVGRVNVFAYQSGFCSVEEIRSRFPAGIDERRLVWMVRRLLDVLGFVHRQGWLHGAVLPPHVLFDLEYERLLLVGWGHAQRLHRPLRFAPTRFKSWYPLECAARRPASTSVDLYLAAKTIVYLAGGDPATGRLPDAFPRELQQFFEACLHDAPRMRPQDAWELRRAFMQLAARLQLHETSSVDVS